MLDDFEFTQPKAYKMLKNTIKKNRCSHAYIIENNGTEDAFNFAKSISKYLFCPFNYTNNKECNNCSKCHQIDNETYLDLKIINPDGMWIKKNQMTELEEEFSNKSILGNKRIYIINHADKMNVMASNTILKFLEEPENNIVAILIVDNIYNLLPTIISRCQIISLQKSLGNNLDTEILGNNLGNKTNSEFSQNNSESNIDNVINFVSYLENYGIDAISMENKLWFKNFKDKESNILALDIMLDFYKSILDYKLLIENNTFKEYEEIKNKIAKKNTINNLCDKINIVFKAKEKFKYNANNNLLLDKLIIDIERIK